MNEMALTVFIGVFSGILTAIFIWGSIQVFNKIITPWYQQTIYRGINISGSWAAKYEFLGNVIVEQSIEIKQKGHLISGAIVSRNKIPSKGEDLTTFIIKGEIFDNYVDVEYRINDKKYIGRGSLLLKVKDGGEKLIGALIAIDRFSTEIMTAEEVMWNRKK
jgi:hypothetical protein